MPRRTEENNTDGYMPDVRSGALHLSIEASDKIDESKHSSVSVLCVGN